MAVRLGGGPEPAAKEVLLVVAGALMIVGIFTTIRTEVGFPDNYEGSVFVGEWTPPDWPTTQPDLSGKGDAARLTIKGNTFQLRHERDLRRVCDPSKSPVDTRCQTYGYIRSGQAFTDSFTLWKKSLLRGWTATGNRGIEEGSMGTVLCSQNGSTLQCEILEERASGVHAKEVRKLVFLGS